jgi:hypothetical protein
MNLGVTAFENAKLNNSIKLFATTLWTLFAFQNNELGNKLSSKRFFILSVYNTNLTSFKACNFATHHGDRHLVNDAVMPHSTDYSTEW